MDNIAWCSGPLFKDSCLRCFCAFPQKPFFWWGVGSTIVDILSLCSEKIERESQQFVSMTLHSFNFFGTLSYKETPFRRFPTDGSLGNTDGSYDPGGIGLRHWLMLLLIRPSFLDKKVGESRASPVARDTWVSFWHILTPYRRHLEAVKCLRECRKGSPVPPRAIYCSGPSFFAVPWPIIGQVPKPFRRKGIRLMDMD